MVGLPQARRALAALQGLLRSAKGADRDPTLLPAHHARPGRPHGQAASASGRWPRAQGLLRSAEGADREWAAAQAAALPLTALVDAGAARVAVLAAAARGPCTAHSRPGGGSVILPDPNPHGGGGGGGALPHAEQALEELLEVYAARWVEITRHPARHQRRRRFGHAAPAAGAAPGGKGEPDTSLAWRGVLGGWRRRDERRHGAQLAQAMQRAAHYVMAEAERVRDAPRARRVMAAAQRVRPGRARVHWPARQGHCLGWERPLAGRKRSVLWSRSCIMAAQQGLGPVACAPDEVPAMAPLHPCGV
jgi:hypothetical protein